MRSGHDPCAWAWYTGSTKGRVDAVRKEIDYLRVWYTRDYSAFGYRVVRVPILPPEERLEFVLERLSEQGLIAQPQGGKT